MANLTSDRKTQVIPSTLNQPTIGPYGVAAATKWYRGLALCLDASARPKNPGTVTDLVAGFTLGEQAERLDNSAGANDATSIQLFTGVAKWDLHGTNPPTVADTLKPAYFSDNHTVSKSAADGSYGGIIIKVESDGVWVWTGPATSSQRPVPIASGQGTLVAGAATITTTLVKTASLIMLTPRVLGGAAGILRVSTITDSTSFVVTSSSGTDTSTFDWAIIA